MRAALEGGNLAATLRQLGLGLHSLLLKHVLRFTFTTLGGLRLKRDLTALADTVRGFGVEELFDTLCTRANLFIVVPHRCSLARTGSGGTGNKQTLLPFLLLN
jgi:hypothetical protein